jgi:hypothetical protein
MIEDNEDSKDDIFPGRRSSSEPALRGRGFAVRNHLVLFCAAQPQSITLGLGAGSATIDSCH